MNPSMVVSDLERLNAVSARLEFSKKIAPAIRMLTMGGYAREEYSDQEYRHRFDLRVGAISP